MPQLLDAATELRNECARVHSSDGSAKLNCYAAIPRAIAAAAQRRAGATVYRGGAIIIDKDGYVTVTGDRVTYGRVQEIPSSEYPSISGIGNIPRADVKKNRDTTQFDPKKRKFILLAIAAILLLLAVTNYHS
jgi:hypothetical protein